MGADSSKPTSSSGEHVFNSGTATSFSQNIVDDLQSSPESDRSRAHDTELHIQNRVHSELKRLEDLQNKRLAEIKSSLEAPAETNGDKAKDAQPSLTQKLASVLSSESKEDVARKDLDREGVQREIDTLRKKLSQRKLKEDVINDKQVEKTRSAVIECLRANDRRPLDCWQEVQAFQQEVSRLEKAFLGKVLE